MKSLRNLFRFYIGVSDLVVLALLLAVFWRPFTNVLFLGTGWITQSIKWPDWAPEFARAFFAELFAAAIIGSLVVAYLRTTRRHAMAGKYRASDIASDGGATDWGEVTLLYQLTPDSPFGARMRMALDNKNIRMEGEGIVVQDQHFVGFYREVSNPVRRRCGAFFMTLNGQADGYEGEYVFLDPDVNQRTRGIARWTRIA